MMIEWPPDFSLGSVEREVLSYLHENAGRGAGHIRYEIVRVDGFEIAGPTAVFATVVRELFTLPSAKEVHTHSEVILAVLNREDGSLIVYTPKLCANLAEL